MKRKKKAKILDEMGKIVDKFRKGEYYNIEWDIPPKMHGEVKRMDAVKEYIAPIDNKKRITIRGASYSYYNVREYNNGCIMLEPRIMTVPKSVSARALADMDQAIANFKRGDVSPEIDLSDF